MFATISEIVQWILIGGGCIFSWLCCLTAWANSEKLIEKHGYRTHRNGSVIFHVIAIGFTVLVVLKFL